MVGASVHEKEGVDGMKDIEREIAALEAKVRRAKKQARDEQRAAELKDQGFELKWEEKQQTVWVLSCGNCGEQLWLSQYFLSKRTELTYRFCPFCGAKIKGVD